MSSEMGLVEKKVLGALLILADEDNVAKATFPEIAEKMGYKTFGGAISFAIRLLEINNYITKTDKSTYKILL